MSACIVCGGEVTVYDSRNREGYVRRKYRCLKKGHKFETREQPVTQEEVQETARREQEQEAVRRVSGLLKQALTELDPVAA